MTAKKAARFVVRHGADKLALLTITTYGLGAGVAAVQDHWSTWWADHVGAMPEDGEFHD